MGKSDDPENEDVDHYSLRRRERSNAYGSGLTIPERVAQFYYFLGLFCSTYSGIIITAAISFALVSCYPLLSLPLPGNRPQYFTTPYENYSVPVVDLPFEQSSSTISSSPRWYKGSPSLFIQQIVIKSSVLPWNDNLILTDAFRGSLAESFRFLSNLKKMESINSSIPDLSQLCFQVGEVKSKVLRGTYSMLPENTCLIVSPANFWSENYIKFQEDPAILATILNYRSQQKGRSGLAEILLGMNIKETGLKRYPFRSRQRIVSYAVTLVFHKFDSRFIDNLKSELHRLYPSQLPRPLSTSDTNVDKNETATTKLQPDPPKIVHIFYPSQSSMLELIPLICTYAVMFIYVYFSVKKVEMIKSKFGVSLSAVITVVASLCMSIGLCSHFGMSNEISAKTIFPYLIIVIGLENILVLTRSVVSTAAHLDIKIRVAQGLSKEGWSITKNLLAEVTILTIGFFTFLPRIQEFCILTLVGLLSDFFLQTFFFATVLSIDIRRSELASTSKHHGPPYVPFRTPIHPTLNRVKSNPRLLSNGSIGHKNSIGSVSVVAPSKSTAILIKLPKRVRLVYFWARTRFFQRTFIIFMVGWISFIGYEYGIVAHFPSEHEDVLSPMNNLPQITRNRTTHLGLALSFSPSSRLDSHLVNRTLLTSSAFRNQQQSSSSQSTESKLQDYQNEKLQRELYEPNPRSWRRLPPFHWPVLLGVYNVSISGKYISVLPPICISIPVEPNTATTLRHPHEHEQARKFNWQALANAFEPIDFADEYDSNIPKVTVNPTGKLERLKFFYAWDEGREIPYIPATPFELGLVFLLAVPSIVFLTYTIVVFYKCICTRNYAEWRSNWMTKRDTTQEYYTEVVFEALPLVLDGHGEEVECMGNDGNIVASVCLSGVMKIWNATTGDNMLTINRKKYFEQLQFSRVEFEDGNLFHGNGSDGDSISGSSPPGVSTGFLNGPNHINYQSQQGTPPPTGYSWDRPSNFYQRPGGGRLSQTQFSTQGSVTPDSPFGGTVTCPYPLPSHHRKSSISSTSGTGTPILHNQQSFEFSHPPPSYHRRTSSFPNQVPPNPVTSPPIPISSTNETIGYFSDTITQIQSPCRPQSRVGSPLERISESKNYGSEGENPPPIWCLDCQEHLVALGTGWGRIEIWDCFLGVLKCVYDDNSGAGVMCVKIIGNRLVTARINGSLDFLELESTLGGQTTDVLSSTSLSHRGHVGGESGDRGVNGSSAMFSLDSEIRCVWLATVKAHQQPITCLDSEGGRILTGSQDHCLKVFRLEDHLPLYTLHGHYGPITCLFIDKISPMNSGSGSQDGMLCVWDLLTGFCMYSTQAHDGPVIAITYSVSYIISAGGDNKICVWERFQGHLLNTIQVNHTYCSSLVMLTHNLLISSKQGSLVVWDVRSGAIVRVVRLGHRDNTVFVRQIMACADGILCDYGSQLRLVRFPSILYKTD